MTLKAALDRSKSPGLNYRELLQDKKVYMTKAMVAGLRHQHNLDDFIRIVKLCGTTAYPRLPKKSNRSPISTLVLGVENDHEVVDLRKSGHTLYTKEVVIMAVLRGSLSLILKSSKWHCQSRQNLHHLEVKSSSSKQFCLKHYSLRCNQRSSQHTINFRRL